MTHRCYQTGSSNEYESEEETIAISSGEVTILLTEQTIDNNNMYQATIVRYIWLVIIRKDKEETAISDSLSF